LPFGVITRNHDALLCMINAYKFVCNEIYGMDMGAQKEMKLLHPCAFV